MVFISPVLYRQRGMARRFDSNVLSSAVRLAMTCMSRAEDRSDLNLVLSPLQAGFIARLRMTKTARPHFPLRDPIR